MADCDLVTVGETMVLLHPPSEATLRYAPFFTHSIAGAESNVALALARLGKRARWISRLGDDPFGDMIVATLAGEGVDTSCVIRDAGAPTAVFFREFKAFGEPQVYYYRRHSAASRLAPEDARPAWLAGARLLHVTGITPALGPHTLEAVTHVMRQARQQGLSVAFDPNLRRKLWDENTARAALLSLIPLCDIFLPGLEEAEFLLGPHAPADYAAAFHALGPQVVVLKMGAQGALGSLQVSPDHETQAPCHVPAYPITHVLDPIGAGDAFAAGLLSVLLDTPLKAASDLAPETLQRALTRANLMGALATQFRGDWTGLPYRAELEAMESGRLHVTR